ncbi:hypothetical protein GCM10008905_29900 [Clostridium malenominatum]|uniref:Bacteriocin immunity protein n=1 Tax=Clostridium malenominatum TaxID=1539 RepID=A0ABN1J5R5_9CLOT
MKNEVLERKVMFTLILFSIISALLTLNKVYFLSTLAQYLYYFIYIFITSLSLFILSKKYKI